MTIEIELNNFIKEYRPIVFDLDSFFDALTDEEQDDFKEIMQYLITYFYDDDKLDAYPDDHISVVERLEDCQYVGYIVTRKLITEKIILTSNESKLQVYQDLLTGSEQTQQEPRPTPSSPEDILDSCPFCDGTAKPAQAPTGATTEEGHIWLMCQDCGTSYSRPLSDL